MNGLIHMKELNMMRIIKIIREKGPISRIDISAITKIPQPTITRITDQLLGANMIQESGTVPSVRGRRPVLLSFNPVCYYAIGVHVGRSKVAVALSDLDGNVVCLYSQGIATDSAFETVLSYIHQGIRHVMEEGSIHADHILGIGVGLPGPLNQTDEGLVSPPYFFGQANIPLRKMLEDQHRLPVYIDNSSNAAALAEKWFGKGIGLQHFLYIFAENGIGAGLVANGNLYRGSYGEASIIGHSTISIGGERCTCGNYGCLETFVSIQKIVDQGKFKLKHEFADERKWFPEEIETITFDDLVAAQNRGSKLAEQLFREAGHYLGIGIANAINMFNPEIVFLGGKLGRSSDYLADAVKAALLNQVLVHRGKKTPVVVSEIAQPVVLGAAALAIDNAFFLYSELPAKTMNTESIEG